MTGRQFLTGRQLLTGWHRLPGVLLLLLSGVVPAFAQASRANPYQNLFKPPDLKATARQQNAPATPQLRVEGGMPRIQLDPCIDPKIFIGQKPICK